jgi:hypothetical protein
MHASDVYSSLTLGNMMGGCADECSVVWPYLLESGDEDGMVVPDNVAALRAEFAGVVAERRRRLQVAPRAAKRQRTRR